MRSTMKAFLLLLGLILGAAAPGYAQEEEDSWTDYAEQADDWYSAGSGAAEDISDGDLFSAVTQGVISTWRSFNQTYTPPVMREWVDQAWQENQDELDRQRETRDSWGAGSAR
jgi:hypothetical protein